MDMIFYYYIHIHNTTSHGSEGNIPYNTVSRKIFDRSKMRIFGSWVTVLKNGKRPALIDHSRHGRFAAYSRTTKNILYVPDNNPGKLMMQTTHAVIDKLNCGMKIAPPVTIALRKALGHEAVLDPNVSCSVQLTHSIDTLSGCEQFAWIDEYTIWYNDWAVNGAVIETDVKTNRWYLSHQILEKYHSDLRHIMLICGRP